MADQKKRISELPESTSTKGLITLGVNEQNESVKIPLGAILEGITPQVNQAVTAANEAKELANSATSVANNALAEANEAMSNADNAKDEAEAAVSWSQAAISTSNLGSTVRFDGFIEFASIGLVSVPSQNVLGIFYVQSAKRFAAKYSGGYANNWPGAEKYMAVSCMFGMMKHLTSSLQEATRPKSMPISLKQFNLVALSMLMCY